MRGSNFFIPYATPIPRRTRRRRRAARRARGSAPTRARLWPRPIASIFIALSALSAIVPTHASIAHANTVACTRYTSTASVAIGPNARGTATHVSRHQNESRPERARWTRRRDPPRRRPRGEVERRGENHRSNTPRSASLESGALFRERRPRVGASSTDGVKRLGRRVERRERRDGDGDGERARRAGPVDVVERAGRARARGPKLF